MTEATKQPTPTQKKYLSFIHACTEGFGCGPAESEIASAMKVSPPSANQMVKTLESKGFIQRQPGVPRSIEILLPTDSIPKWKKKITKTEWVWMREDSSSSSSGQSAIIRDIYRFKITLKDTQPAIWRRIETQDVELGKLHELIQTSMGWTDSHLHCFEIGDRRYSAPHLIEFAYTDLGETSYAGVRISDLVTEYGTNMKLAYAYDYGDGWQHEIELEAVTEPESRARYPRCIDGDRACPPEDCGGVWGFVDFVEAITNPAHEEHENMLEWNGPFDPANFSPADATRRVKKGFPG